MFLLKKTGNRMDEQEIYSRLYRKKTDKSNDSLGYESSKEEGEE